MDGPRVAAAAACGGGARAAGDSQGKWEQRKQNCRTLGVSGAVSRWVRELVTAVGTLRACWRAGTVAQSLAWIGGRRAMQKWRGGAKRLELPTDAASLGPTERSRAEIQCRRPKRCSGGRSALARRAGREMLRQIGLC
jgi:hypothetical protein